MLALFTPIAATHPGLDAAADTARPVNLRAQAAPFPISRRPSLRRCMPVQNSPAGMRRGARLLPLRAPRLTSFLLVAPHTGNPGGNA